MAVREISFTVTVRYDDTRIVNPGHLVGGMTDEIQGWGGNGEHYQVKVSEATHETPTEYAFREAVKVVVHQLDYTEGKTAQTSRAYGDTVLAMVQHHIETYCELTGMEPLKAYMKVQAAAITQRVNL